MSPIVEEKKKLSLRRLLFLGGSSDKKEGAGGRVGAVETAFVGRRSPSSSTTPDTSLILEVRREELKRRDWKRSASLRRVSFSPTPPCPPSDTESEAGGEVRRILRPPLPKPRTLLPPPPTANNKEEEWNGEKGRTSSSQEQGSSGRSGGEEEGRRSGRRNRDDQRRHTLGAPDHGYQSALARSMDLEMGSKSRRKSPQQRSYPPPNMLLDDDPGIMSEVETSSTGFRRGNKQRSSLPVVRTPSKTLERPLGLVFLQYRSETKRALLPNEITSIDTVKALFVRSFPKQLTMEYLDSPHVKIYIHDSSKDMFYELEDLRSHLRDIRDRSVLRLFESGDVVGGTAPPGSTWDQDQSYFSEPEFDSEYQHQHIHKTKGSKGPVGGGGGQAYYMTHSFPPGSLPRIGAASLLRAYPPPPAPKPPPSVDGYMSSPERGGPRGYAGGGYPPASSYEDPYYAQYSARTGAITPVIDEEASDTEGLDESYSQYGVKLAPRGQFPPPQPAAIPQAQIDATRLRVEHMERQLASLTGLVQKALNHPPATVLTPAPPIAPAAAPPYRSASASDDFDKHSSSSSASLPDETFLRTEKPPKLGRDKSVSFEKSVSFSDEPPDMNSPKQHSPQHSADTKPAKPAIKSSTLPRMSSQVTPTVCPRQVSLCPQPVRKGVVGVPARQWALLPDNGITGVSDRERHKPTPPPKPVSLSPGQYESRNVYRDLQLTAEMYNQLRGLQKKAKDLRQEVRNLRRMSQSQAHTVRETIRDTFLKIRSVLMAAGGEGLWSPAGDEARLRVNREGDLYRQQMIRLESDLTELESTVEELRGNVINRKTRVNMSDVESMALVLSKSSKTVADLKLKFPSLQDSIKTLIAQEMDKMVSEEKFLKEEPERLESALRRCKKLTGTLVTLKRLASVQEQRLPDSRLSPTGIDETPPVTPTSGKAAGERSVVGEEQGGGVGGGARSENPLDALLDELQTFSKSGPSAGGTLRRLHSYPTSGGGGGGRANNPPPPPPPRTSSKSPLASPATESSSTESVNSQPASRQELLEQKHQELLKKQRALQEQYTRLQQLQRAPPPDLVQLKKTGSESNLLSKMGLTLAPMSGSLSHLAPTSAPHQPSPPAPPTTTVNKIYETDIL